MADAGDDPGEPDMSVLNGLVAASRHVPGASIHAVSDDDVFDGSVSLVTRLVNSLNGAIGRELDGVNYAFVEASMYAWFPAPLVAECDKQDTVKGQKAIFKANGDKGEPLHFLIHREIWRRPKKGTSDSFGNDFPLHGGAGDWVLIAATNLMHGIPIRVAMLIATAGLAGLYNFGGKDEQLKREWAIEPKAPAAAHLATVLKECNDGRMVSLIQFHLNLLSSLGYFRISDTHPVISTDEAQMAKLRARSAACMEGIPVLKDDQPLNDAEIKLMFHGPLHGASLHGAVGLMIYWSNHPKAGAKIRIRDAPIGDVNKDVAIATAGFFALFSHPMLALVLAQYENDVGELIELMGKYKKAPWKTSSLNYLFAGGEPVILSTRYRATVTALSAAICAAGSTAAVGDSFINSRYIKGVSRKYPGSVKFWAEYFRSIKNKVGKLNAKELGKLLKNVSSKESKVLAIKDKSRDDDLDGIDDDEEAEDSGDGDDDPDGDEYEGGEEEADEVPPLFPPANEPAPDASPMGPGSSKIAAKAVAQLGEGSGSASA